MATAPRGRPRPSYNRSLSTRFKSLTSLTDASLIRDELLEHSRFIRDWLVPLLEKGCQIPETEIEILSEILERLGSLRITVELLRYSRVEKALLAILETENFAWPTRIVEKSRYLLRKWEISLGQPLDGIRADFFGSQGRLESLSVVPFRRSSAPDLEMETIWQPLRSHSSMRASMPGNAGFDVGAWFLNPQSAFAAGMVSTPIRPFIGCSTSTNSATAIIMIDNQETLLGPHLDGSYIKYHPPPYTSVTLSSSAQQGLARRSSPILSLSRLFMTTADSPLRVLRSWTLKSPFAPKAGVRYDGLYRIVSQGVKLSPPNEWNFTFTLARLGIPEATIGTIESEDPVEHCQLPLSNILSIPTSDMMDDWADYQLLTNAEFRKLPLGTVSKVEPDTFKPPLLTDSVSATSSPSPYTTSYGPKPDAISKATYPTGRQITPPRVGRLDSGYTSSTAFLKTPSLGQPGHESQSTLDPGVEASVKDTPASSADGPPAIEPEEFPFPTQDLESSGMPSRSSNSILGPSERSSFVFSPYSGQRRSPAPTELPYDEPSLFFKPLPPVPPLSSTSVRPSSPGSPLFQTTYAYGSETPDQEDGTLNALGKTDVKVHEVLSTPRTSDSIDDTAQRVPLTTKRGMNKITGQDVEGNMATDIPGQIPHYDDEDHDDDDDDEQQDSKEKQIKVAKSSSKSKKGTRKLMVSWLQKMGLG